MVLLLVVLQLDDVAERAWLRRTNCFASNERESAQSSVSGMSSGTSMGVLELVVFTGCWLCGDRLCCSRRTCCGPSDRQRHDPDNEAAPSPAVAKPATTKPFAIIQRWLIADINAPDKTGSPTTKPMLAVTRLPPGPVCHVAYIDGQANRNPNELARQAADEFARDFKCGKDEVKVVDEKGAAVSLAKR